eukprot:gene6285-7007_t
MEIISLAEKVEEQYEEFLGLAPDPFDDRHPSQSYPDCKFGDTLRLIVGEKEFMERLTASYFANSDNDFDLNCQAARLILNILSGLEGKIFEDWESVGKTCYQWAKLGKEPLRTYAVDILAVGMASEENAGMFREDNQSLVPIILKRLKCLKDVGDLNLPAVQNINKMTPKSSSKSGSKYIRASTSKSQKKREDESASGSNSKFKWFDGLTKKSSQEPAMEKSLTGETTDSKSTEVNEESKVPSNSNAEQTRIAKEAKANKSKKQLYKRPAWCLWPLNVGTQQRSLLAYLTALGQYQELLPFAFEHDALDLIFYYMNAKLQRDSMLALRGLEYLSALMCHKKFVAEFVRRGGVQKLLEIPRQSSTSTGMSVCLFYLAYNDDAMERVCLLPHPLLTDLVKYALWLMDSGMHDSARCYATLFFSLVFPFRAIQDLFLSMDGIRRLVNTVTVLSILLPEESVLMANEEAFAMRQTVKHTVVALRKLFDSQLSIKADEVRRNLARREGTLPPDPVPAYKAMTLNASHTVDNVQLLLDNSSATSGWHSILTFKKLSGIPLLFQILAFAASWEAYSSRNDVIRMVLDTLFVLSVHPKAQLSFCQNVIVSNTETQSGIRILLRAAEGNLVQSDGEIQKIALQVLCNCVCGPKPQVVSGIPRGEHAKLTIGDILMKMWNAVRLQNGIKVLLGLMSAKTPITEADHIRCFACKALCGLSRSDRIQQVLHKLIFFYSGQLQMLMGEPVLPDKTNEHVKFCNFASELIERVTGKALTEHSSTIPMLSTLKKADVVSQTKISYSEKELLELIVDHLETKGLHTSAIALQREALLKGSSNEHASDPSFASPIRSKRRKVPLNSKSQELSLTPGDLTPGTPSIYRPGTEKEIDMQLDVARNGTSSQATNNFHPTLDNIVKNYLREQHAHCRNPVTTCPEFSLTRPHQCPEPHYKTRAPSDITRRISRRQIQPRHGGPMGSKLNRKFIFSRFRPVGTIEDTDELNSFMCARFLPEGDLILLGTKTGDVKMYNVYTGQEEATYACHRYPVVNCEPSRDLQFFLTSTELGQPSGALWTFLHSSYFEMKFSFPYDYYVKFSSAQDQVIGTSHVTAHIYDLNSGALTLTLEDVNSKNQYHKNFATFNATDDLVLNDGCLWDVRARKMVHKFDKFNDFVSGVFHPSGLEIIINSEIWDIRTFHLLDTCTALDQCRTIFNNQGDIMYGVKHVTPDTPTTMSFGPNLLGPFDSTFRTFDSYDYSVIATNDVKKTIFDICPDNNDSLVAVIEGNCSSGNIDSVCRLYEVGRLKKIDGEDSDEEQAEEEDETNQIEDDDEFDDAVDESTLLEISELLSTMVKQVRSLAMNINRVHAMMNNNRRFGEEQTKKNGDKEFSIRRLPWEN